MLISEALYGELVDHALQEAPNECCGMVAFDGDQAVEVHRATNDAASPLRYELNPKDQLRIELGIEDRGLQLGAIYHSHTRSEPYPSQTDINLAFYPDALYLIVGVADEQPKIRAFKINDGQVTEVEIKVISDGA